MHKQRPLLEWHVAEGDADWERLVALPPLNIGLIANHRRGMQRILWRVAALLLLAVSARGGTRHLDQVTFSYPPMSVTTTVQSEVRAIGPDRELAADELWGPVHRVETRFFIYYFRQHDAPVVIAVAPQVDALYTTLRRNLGLGFPLSAEKLVIEVSVTQHPGHITPWNDTSNRFRVPSPALYTTSGELTDAELLAQSIALQQIDQLLAQASEQYQIKFAWRPMLNGLRLWQVWDMDLPLAIWKKEIVQWLYVDLPAVAPEQPLMLPDRYAELCAAHKLWMMFPLQLNIPLGCTALDQAALLFPIWDPRDSLAHLEQLTVLIPPNQYLAGAGSLYAAHRPGQTVALATLIEYAVITYGHECLPALMAGLGRYETWETLLPAVFGVSASEFESGWQAYLTIHYGMPAG